MRALALPLLLLVDFVVASFTCGPYATTSLKRKDTVVVCVEYDFTGDGNATAYGRFHPDVDVLAQYEIDEKSSGNLWNRNLNSTAKVRAVVGTKRTPWVSLFQRSGNSPVSTATFFTLMINIDNGKLSTLNWDNRCVCDLCFENQCHKSCTATSCAAQVKMFVVWTGTDTDNTVMLSAANRYSELSKYSTTQMFDNMQDTASGYCDNGACDVPTIW